MTQDVKKVVYLEGHEVRALIGQVEFSDDFIRVRKGDGEVLINRSVVVCVKDAGRAEL